MTLPGKSIQSGERTKQPIGLFVINYAAVQWRVVWCALELDQ